MPEPTQEQITEMRARAYLEKKSLLPKYADKVRHTEFFDLHYRFYAPADQSAPRPLVLFFHGLGEVGDDNVWQLTAYDGGTVWVTEQEEGRQEPCFVLAPQCPRVDDFRWPVDVLLCVGSVLRGIMEEYPVDKSRIYVTGLSLGGFATWEMNRLFPGLFAALVPCCPACMITAGGGPVMRDLSIAPCAEVMASKPVWMFHAEDDPIVPVAISRAMRAELEGLGKQDLIYTEYPAALDFGHGCWRPAYQNAEMRRWLLSQRLK